MNQIKYDYRCIQLQRPNGITVINLASDVPPTTKALINQMTAVTFNFTEWGITIEDKTGCYAAIDIPYANIQSVDTLDETKPE